MPSEPCVEQTCYLLMLAYGSQCDQCVSIDAETPITSMFVVIVYESFNIRCLRVGRRVSCAAFEEKHWHSKQFHEGSGRSEPAWSHDDHWRAAGRPNH